MIAPSLTLARQLYSRRYGVPLADIEVQITGVKTPRGFEWCATVDTHHPDIDIAEASARTEQGALGKLCRVLERRP